MATILLSSKKLTPLFKETFKESLDELDGALQERVEKVVQRIMDYGEAGVKNHALLNEFKGKRSGHVTDNLRVLFTVCSECLKAKMQDNNCESCEGIDGQVVFHFVGDHKEIDSGRWIDPVFRSTFEREPQTDA